MKIVDVVSHYATVIRHEGDPTGLITYTANGPVAGIAISWPKTPMTAGTTTLPYTAFSELPRNAIVSETGSGDWVTHHVPYGTIKWTVILNTSRRNIRECSPISACKPPAATT